MGIYDFDKMVNCHMCVGFFRTFAMLMRGVRILQVSN